MANTPNHHPDNSEPAAERKKIVFTPLGEVIIGSLLVWGAVRMAQGLIEEATDFQNTSSLFNHTPAEVIFNSGEGDSTPMESGIHSVEFGLLLAGASVGKTFTDMKIAESGARRRDQE